MKSILFAVGFYFAPHNLFGLKSILHTAMYGYHRLIGTGQFCESCNLPRAATRYHTLVGHVCDKCFADCKQIEMRV